MIKYMDDHFGLIDTETDMAYTMDDYGNLVNVPFSIPDYYWQDSDI